MKLPLGRSAVLLTTAVATLAVSLPSTALAHSNHSKLKEYSLDEYAVPADLTTGPDGALYAPDGSLDRLWRVTTKGKVSHIDVPGGPAGVATGKDGALWVTARTTDQIHRVTTKGQITSYQLPEDPTGKRAFPTDIVAGPDGALWFTEAHRDRIGRITTTGDVKEYEIPTPGAFASDITVGPDGALWFTESSGDKVGRITTTEREVIEYPATPGSQPAAIVTGRDGSLYFAEMNTNAITRMNTKGEVTRRSPLPIVDSTPVSLAPTRHGVYVSQHSIGSIGFMSYGGSFSRPLRTKSAPDAITIGSDGNLWYASGNESKIGRIEIDC
jgi:virginiamycin B lyase